MITAKAKKVIVGMSGGVDSSVSAALLKNQGYEVSAVFMKNWSENFGVKGDCPWEKDFRDAQAAAAVLDIPLYTFNFEKEYKEKVVNYFFHEYQAGRTPNPDVICNQEIKFRLFFDKALKLGADYIATGHYARISEDEKFDLLKGIDRNKDQSYFLYAIDPQILSRIIFPIGGLTKPEVRKQAARLQLPNKDKKDSVGICFIGEIDLRQFLSQSIRTKAGDIIDLDTGEKIGRHEGLAWYTIGQRRGMGLGGTGLPLYVAAKDMQKNELYVVKGAHNPALYKQTLLADNLRWLKKPEIPGAYQCKIRYRQADQKCRLKNINQNKLQVDFDQPQRAVTPGQSIVFYQHDICLGGGIIV